MKRYDNEWKVDTLSTLRLRHVKSWPRYWDITLNYSPLDSALTKRIALKRIALYHKLLTLS